MKNNLIIVAILCLISVHNTYSQYVPNGGFENWEKRVLYVEPENWNTGNQEAFISDTSTAFNTPDSYSGNSALRIATVVTEADTLFGYTFCNGTITGGGVLDTFRYIGGIPVSGAPDTLYGYFKYSIAANDTAIVLLSFKKDGNIISQDIFSLTGTQNSYVKMGWEVYPMAEIPDSAMVAFACSNPDNPMPGGWLQVDSIWFAGIDDSIPNADFEVWDETSSYEPEHWVTGNLFSSLFGADTCATPATDAHSGNYAIRIEGIETNMPGEEGITKIIGGFAMPYTTSFTFGETLPTFDVSFNPSALMGYYKFDPFENDTAFIFISLTDDEGETYESGTILLASNIYLPFAIPLIYPDGVTITEVSIVASTTTHFMESGGPGGEVGSVLILDDIDLISPCDAFPPYTIDNYIMPDCDTAIIDAGDGWDEYLWSTGATTQILTVAVDETTTYSVIVKDASTGCEFTDEIEIEVSELCGDAVKQTDFQPMNVEVYPNPTSELITVEFQNMNPGQHTTEMIDITGKVILKEQIETTLGTKKFSIDLAGYPRGLYLLKISGENFSYLKKILLD